MVPGQGQHTDVLASRQGISLHFTATTDTFSPVYLYYKSILVIFKCCARTVYTVMLGETVKLREVLFYDDESQLKLHVCTYCDVTAIVAVAVLSGFACTSYDHVPV